MVEGDLVNTFVERGECHSFITAFHRELRLSEVNNIGALLRVYLDRVVVGPCNAQGEHAGEHADNKTVKGYRAFVNFRDHVLLNECKLPTDYDTNPSLVNAAPDDSIDCTAMLAKARKDMFKDANHWLGHGLYFFIDNLDACVFHAQETIRRNRRLHPWLPVAIIEATFPVGTCMDLSRSTLLFFNVILEDMVRFNNALGGNRLEALTSKEGKVDKSNEDSHRVDCIIVSFLEYAYHFHKKFPVDTVVCSLHEDKSEAYFPRVRALMHHTRPFRSYLGTGLDYREIKITPEGVNALLEGDHGALSMNVKVIGSWGRIEAIDGPNRINEALHLLGINDCPVSITGCFPACEKGIAGRIMTQMLGDDVARRLVNETRAGVTVLGQARFALIRNMRVGQMIGLLFNEINDAASLQDRLGSIASLNGKLVEVFDRVKAQVGDSSTLLAAITFSPASTPGSQP